MNSGQPPAAHPVDRARLTQFGPLAPPVHRYNPAPRHTEWVRHYWVPVWDLPAGKTVTEYVLQYPSCLVVVSDTYARFYGVVTGRSQVELAGRGWAVGVMLQPGAGPAVCGVTDLRHVADTHCDLARVPSMAPAISAIRATMTADPASAHQHRRAIARLAGQLDALPALTDEAKHVSDVVALVESDPDLRTVAELSARAGWSERQLQRVLRRYLGLTPKWLIQRRRLHEASDRLKHGTVKLADLAHDVGYTDQAHFTRDFRKVTGYSPGAFARSQADSRKTDTQ
ncbi:MAG: helix-turn-helix transcriptional regulator [Ornithinimicrobium sp.]